MKLIVTGATGFVGTEVIRLALQNKAVTSVFAIARKTVHILQHLRPEANPFKLHSIVLEDWTNHISTPTLAVTPTKSWDMDFTEVTKVCFENTTNGLENIATVANKTFRFINTSGVTVERDQSKTLPFLADYRLMRGRVENYVLDFARNHKPYVQATVNKPGGIEGPGHPKTAAATGVFSQFGPTPWVHVSELAAAMIEQCLSGVTKDPLWGQDLQEIGSKVLSRDDYVPME